MIFVLFVILFVFLFKIKFFSPIKVEYNTEFLTKDNTTTINGLFVFFVFMSHYLQYVNSYYFFDVITVKFFSFLGQCINCSFLFYSGYGVHEQIKKNRKAYCHKLITNRFPKLFIRFVICVLLYILMNAILGIKYSLNTVMLSLIGFSSVGNSAWYIFYIMLAYIFVYLSYRLIDNNAISLILFNGLILIYTVCVFVFYPNKNAYYLTTFVFPLGMFFSRYKDVIVSKLEKKYLVFLLVSLVSYFISFIIRHFLRLPGPFYNITAICFSLVLVFFSFKVRINSTFFKIIGENVFYIYITKAPYGNNDICYW